ncbi:serine hydrolase [Arthrobacter sp. APC 3897]|uniref:serine hydrolase n=1 Tax=Arthrobacter sp. APC 3897 TaxID=3035204 RepID=UPI0025B62857|nr:serine hydrolase [Arthrobacter sp. APC 3897]MDN3483114.1 serine hydrolase [Arthrobacter sp. APC 3897]
MTFRRTVAAVAALLLPLTAAGCGMVSTESAPAGAARESSAAVPLPADQADMLSGALDACADDINASADPGSRDAGTEFSAALYEKSSGRAWHYNAGGSYLEASLVKVPILLTLLREATEEQRDLTPEEEYQAVMMIEYSDNDATSALYGAVGGAPELARTYELLGVAKTDASEVWGVNSTGVEDQLRIARALLEGVDWINPGLLEFAVQLMENVDYGQRWGISSGVSDRGAEIALKNGWLQDDSLSWNVGSMGFVRAGDAEYAVVVLTSGTDTMQDGVSVVERVARIINSFVSTGTAGLPDTESPMWRAGGLEA